MRVQILVFCSVLVALASADCGCLKNEPSQSPSSTCGYAQVQYIPRQTKCCKNLRVIETPQNCGMKIIFRNPKECPPCPTSTCPPAPLPFSVQVPPTTTPRAPVCGKSYNYKMQPIIICSPQCQCPKKCEYVPIEYKFDVEAPPPAQTPAPFVPLKLKYRTDRVVVPAPPCACPCDPTPTTKQPELSQETLQTLIRSIQNSLSSSSNTQQSEETTTKKCSNGPIFERLPPSCGSDYSEEERYETEQYPVDSKTINNNCVKCSRCKRDTDLMKHGYNFFVNMLPPYFQSPLKDTLRAMEHMRGPNEKKILRKPQLSLKEKLEEHNIKIQEKLQRNLHKSNHKLNHVQKTKPLFESNAKNSFPSQYQTYKTDPFLDKKYKDFVKSNVLSKPSQNYYSPKFYSRMIDESEEQNVPDEALLIKKLKKLTGESTTSDLDPLREAFLEKLYEKPESRQKRSLDQEENNIRKKRTIILGSDEINLPYYEISHSEENFVNSNEENEEYENTSDEIVGTRYIRKPAVRPDIVIGKNIIENVVKNEFNKYQQSLQKEQVKAKEADPFQLNQIIPHNPIFLLLTAPMKLLKNFQEFNKGPIGLALPKLIYTTKKYFKDFGKNLHKNCLNLASDIIGDFDNVHPNVVNQVVQPGRYKRDADFSGIKNDTKQFEPDYSMVFDCSSLEGFNNQNFQNANNNTVRKKRYIVQVVDEDHVEDYLTKQLEENFEYLEPFKNYHNKVNDFILQLGQNYKPLNVHGPQEDYYDDNQKSSEEEYEKPKKKKLKVKQVKPRVIIDNNGIPFMEYNGYKRPLSLHKKNKNGMVSMRHGESSEESQDKIVGLIQRAKEHSEVVGNAPDFMPKKTIKEKISSILKDTDNLVHFETENYDEIFDEMIKLQHIKMSIVQDWKRILLNDQVDDINRKIALLDKFKDLQHTKDGLVKKIAEELKSSDSSFVRKKLIGVLVKLQKLQCLITSVVDDFEEHLKMRTQFNTKKEIKYVDFLSELNFVNGRTRNDLIGSLRKQRDVETNKNIKMVDKLKKVLTVEDGSKIEDVGKLVWELTNVEKLQKNTIKDLHKKCTRNYKIKKELKILFDLQRRYDSCLSELYENLNLKEKESSNNVGKKTDVKNAIEEMKRKHEEFKEKLMEKNRLRLESMKNNK